MRRTRKPWCSARRRCWRRREAFARRANCRIASYRILPCERGKGQRRRFLVNPSPAQRGKVPAGGRGRSSNATSPPSGLRPPSPAGGGRDSAGWHRSRSIVASRLKSLPRVLAAQRRVARRQPIGPRCHTRQRLLAGIAASSSRANPARRASASTAATSRMPMRASRDFSERSNSALLWLVNAPP